jgi:hypothetical protein
MLAIGPVDRNFVLGGIDRRKLIDSDGFDPQKGLDELGRLGTPHHFKPNIIV